MAELKVLNSGSSGNCYILKCESETILLELGIPWSKILHGLSYNISSVVGALVSHKHGDHSKSVKNAIEAFIPVFSCAEVQEVDEKVKVLKTGLKTQIGGFKVQPINVEHSCECYSFIIEHDEFGKLLFVTDCKRFPYKVKECNHIIMEANYDEWILIDNICNNEDTRSRHEQHMEISNTIESLKANYSEVLQNVILCHLSNGNSNERDFVKKTKMELSFNDVYCAVPNLVVPLFKEDF